MNDFPELTPWVKSALVFIGSVLYLVKYLLGVALWSICADLVEYLRGE